MDETQSERGLVERAREGDREAFGRLVERYQGRMEALVSARMGGLVRGTAEVADITQETFARALRSLETFRWRGEESFLRWLGGIAENLIAKAANREKRHGLLRLEGDSAGSDPSPSKVLRREERFRRLEQALEALPPDYREVIRLARIEGLKHEEIAARMNRSHAAVRQLLIRALRQLRERFGDTESLHLPHRILDPHEAGDAE
ncbi:MAG: sigma-70 family RNA polymerase sigma factor [Planctomycetes bacterium]|nr:sigma-70 family RNA polymerase sigma factor [Planctomycetota bacterium]